MSRRQKRPQEKRVVPAGEHTNADLLKEKTRKGSFFSEAAMLQESFRIANKINFRKFGNTDQNPSEVKRLKVEAKPNYADKALVKFW